MKKWVTLVVAAWAGLFSVMMVCYAGFHFWTWLTGEAAVGALWASAVFASAFAACFAAYAPE